MSEHSLEPWIHDHTFKQDASRPGERRTQIVVVVTAITMILEISAGWYFGSMALLADGLHMGSHASALSISALAYFYTRRHASDRRFTFGTGKVNSLAAFASAILLVVFALIMAWESVHRMFAPVSIEFNQAIVVAIFGLLVNGVCLFILGHRHEDGEHAHETGHDHDSGHSHAHSHERRHATGSGAHVDHNLWSAYLHVFADAVTSFLAIGALLAAKYWQLIWLDPLMGVLGAALVTKWSVGLLRASSRVLLDFQAPEAIRRAVRNAIEADSDARISDLHIWAIGPGIYAAEIAVVAHDPQPPDRYIEAARRHPSLVHVTVQLNRHG